MWWKGFSPCLPYPWVLSTYEIAKDAGAIASLGKFSEKGFSLPFSQTRICIFMHESVKHARALKREKCLKSHWLPAQLQLRLQLRFQLQLKEKVSASWRRPCGAMAGDDDVWRRHRHRHRETGPKRQSTKTLLSPCSPSSSRRASFASHSQQLSHEAWPCCRCCRCNQRRSKKSKNLKMKHFSKKRKKKERKKKKNAFKTQRRSSLMLRLPVPAADQDRLGAPRA